MRVARHHLEVQGCDVHEPQYDRKGAFDTQHDEGVDRGIALVASRTEARTWRIFPDGSGDAPTIQAGIDSAATQDTILVGPGTYDENLDTRGKNLSLIGEAGATQTIVDGGLRARVLTLSGGGLVTGLTLRRGQDVHGGGVRVTGPVPALICNNVIEENIAGYFVDQGIGGGLWLDFFSEGTVVEANLIRGNHAGDEGGGAYGEGANQVPYMIRGNYIVENSCHNNGAGMSIGGATIENNVIARNLSDNGVAGLNVYGIAVQSNTIIGNHSQNSANDHGVGITILEGIQVRHNIIAFNGSTGSRGAGIACASAEAVIQCNAIWGNDIDDILGVPACSAAARDDFRLDPQFCAVNPVATLNVLLQSDSPCAPGNHPTGAACGLIGAEPVGCGGVGVTAGTWTQLKQLYR